MNAQEHLQKAAKIMEERGKNYDRPGGERSMAATIAAFNALTGLELTPSHGWLLLTLLKFRRLFTAFGHHADSAEDAIAYAALLAEQHQTDHQSHNRPLMPEGVYTIGGREPEVYP